MGYKIFISIFLSIGVVQCNLTNLKYCDDHFPYLGVINLDEIAGNWNGVEIIRHEVENSEHQVENTNECFHINISERFVQPSRLLTLERNPPGAERFHIRHFVLEWNEGKQKVDYYVQVNNLTIGLWPTEPRNPMIGDETKELFGIIQVLKMTKKHLVLNFCMRLPYSQYFSVVLARNKNQLSPEDMASIHEVFTIKKLSTTTLKTVCLNSALTLRVPYISLLLLLSSIVLAWRSH